MELNGTEDLKKYVDDDIYKIGTVGPTDVVEYFFEYKGDPDDIEYVEKSCGCTEALYADGKIKGHLDISKTGTVTPGTPINKYVYIYLKDGEPRFLRDDKFRKIPNPSKKWFRLQLAGFIKE